ncbi:hypothetical protein BRADI_3g25586v3 [Brachypodium distachyon]|uniref:Uncharacterized protein n=1 Tax=Brachypodium distachyon TaxID=15368 RepID=A0A2K2CZ82_BRADI|nr:hypothetical protein BRADI_3g25586v3 [Brachypodium distachyon]
MFGVLHHTRGRSGRSEEPPSSASSYSPAKEHPAEEQRCLRQMYGRRRHLHPRLRPGS